MHSSATCTATDFTFQLPAGTLAAVTGISENFWFLGANFLGPLGRHVWHGQMTKKISIDGTF